MKKKSVILAFIAVTLFSYDAYSQSKYQGEASVGTAFGVSHRSDTKIVGETIHGVRFSNHFFAGIGVAAHYYWDMSEVVMPVFFNVKGYYTLNSKFSPYASFDAGLGWELDVGGGGGVYFSPGIGLNVKMNWIDSMNFALAFQSQDFGGKGGSVVYNAIIVKVGIQF